jgi:hypothetical protein
MEHGKTNESYTDELPCKRVAHFDSLDSRALKIHYVTIDSQRVPYAHIVTRAQIKYRERSMSVNRFGFPT